MNENLFDKFCHELNLYEAACATKESGSKDMKKPILKRVTLDDFTLEALVLEHYNNLRGIAINYDEILRTACQNRQVWEKSHA